MRFFWIAVLLLTAAAAGAFYLRRDKAAPIVIAPSPAPTEPTTAPPLNPVTSEPAPIITQAAVAKSAPIAAAPAPTPPQTPLPSVSQSSAPAAPQPTPIRTVPPKLDPAPAPPASSDQPDPASAPVPSTKVRPSPQTPPPIAVPEPTNANTPLPVAPAHSTTVPKVETPNAAVATPTPEVKPVQPAAKSPAAPASTDTTSDIASGMANLVGDGTTKSAETTAPSLPVNVSPAPATITTTSSKIKLEPQPDGTVLVDDKFIMKGKGTKDDPYRVTWEQLVSAQDTYQPRLGRKQIPERVKMLDGKWVRISGYIAFPLMAASADEMLMMLNQWDGCCIGVPPTPYDAIEVKLKTAAKGDSRLRTTGTLTGILRVDPYLVKDWLVSLFVMDDGEISETAGAAAQGQHAK